MADPKPDPKPAPPSPKKEETAAQKEAYSKGDSSASTVAPQQSYATYSAAPGAAENKKRTDDRSKDDQAAAHRPKPRPYKVREMSDNIEVDALGAYDNLVGELLPGESGWLPLGDLGEPIGPAVRVLPDPPGRHCRVMANNVGQAGDILVTNTGAPITPIMQPNTDVLPWVAPPDPPITRQSQHDKDREEDRNRKEERKDERAQAKDQAEKQRANDSVQQSGMSR